MSLDLWPRERMMQVQSNQWFAIKDNEKATNDHKNAIKGHKLLYKAIQFSLANIFCSFLKSFDRFGMQKLRKMALKKVILSSFHLYCHLVSLCVTLCHPVSLPFQCVSIAWKRKRPGIPQSKFTMRPKVNINSTLAHVSIHDLCAMCMQFSVFKAEMRIQSLKKLMRL